MAANTKTLNGEFRTNVYFAHVHEPSQYGNYEVNIAVTPEIEKELIKNRLDGKIKSGKESINNGGKYMTLRNAPVDRAGNTSQMVVVDSFGKPMTDLVGNGSECLIYWRAYDHPQYGRIIKFGKMLDWDQEAKTKKFAAMKVISLVEYKAGGNDFFEPLPPAKQTAATKEVEFEIEE